MNAEIRTLADTELIDKPLTPVQCELTIVMPCLNEAETLERCIQKANQSLAENHIDGEVLIADNGSTDGSQEIAQRNGARVVNITRKGYGAALMGGIAAARGKYVIMADSDDSYDLSNIKPLVDKLHEGYQLVMGTRTRGTIMPGAMPPLHRWLGNPVLTGLGNLFFRTHLSDYHCGIRAFDRDAILRLRLRTPGMEFATEMVAKAAIHKVKIAEVPVKYFPDGRTRPPHLRTWRDGWRHLRFMLLLSPSWTLLYPGLLITILGVVGMVLLTPAPLMIGSIGLDVHSLLVAGISVILGVQLLLLWLAASIFAANIGLHGLPKFLKRFLRGGPLATGLIIGGLFFVVGLFPSAYAFKLWTDVQFGALNYRITLRWLIPGVVLIALGSEIFFGSFIISLLNFTEGWTLGSVEPETTAK